MKTMSYLEALKFAGFDRVLCNNVPNIDQSFIDGEEFHSDMWDDNVDGDEFDFWGTYEVFQYYITSASDDDVEYLCKRFSDMHFKYSDALDCWVLLVTHYGTSWSGVMVEDRGND